VTAATKRAAAKPSTACLLDGNVLVALMSADHVHHAAAVRWFASTSGPFATCPITQGTLLRMLMRLADLSIDAALAVLAQVEAHPRHRFWPDALSYGDVVWRGVMGHRQVTDAYLAALARRHRGKLVTFDRGLAVLHADVAFALDAPGD
jgi:toxin-antitoxin system PIN domain toxin